MKAYILKILLKETNIWRRISIPSGYSFHDLHEAIQIVFGWECYHLHEFNAAGILIAADENDDIDMMPDKFRYESDVSLDLILLNVKSFNYVYDFGDWWEHTIKVEKVIDDFTDVPQLIDYGGTMVVEDCHDGKTLMEEAKDMKVDRIEINAILEETFGG